MASYIGKVQIGTATPVLVGSTLYGICKSQANSAAKTVISTDDNTGKFINNNYDQLLQGTTIHIKFVNGNTATSNLTLQVGTVQVPHNIVGNCTCSAGAVISFTLDENEYWVVNDNTITEYEFMTAYNAVNNKVATAADLAALDIQDAAHKDVVTDIGNNTTSTDVPTAAAVVTYVQSMTGGLAGLSGAMHFRGQITDTNVIITDGGNQMPHIEGYDLENGVAKANFSPEPGDVILFDTAEFVWTNNAWEILGDESSYALNSSTDVVSEVSNFTANTLPTLTVTPTSIPNVTNVGSQANLTTTNISVPNVTAAGSATTASVSAGVLNITIGQAPTIAENPITFKGVNEFTKNNLPTLGTAIQLENIITFNQGTQASLSTNDVTVVVPNSTAP